MALLPFSSAPIQATAVTPGSYTLVNLTVNKYGQITAVANGSNSSTTETLTNKTFDTAGTGNVLKINGTTINTVTGTGSVVLATSPSLTTPALGIASATSINKVAITAPATSATLTLANGSSLVTAGAFSTTLTATATTNVTLPTTGTLATLAGSETFTNKIINANANTFSWDGWIGVTDTWTFVSYDSPTSIGVISVPTDATTKYTPGQRIKFTQTTVMYGIIVAVSATTLTCYFGLNYMVSNTTISAISYSHVKAPYGFPQDPLVWTVSLIDTTNRTQTNPTTGTFYNPGSLQLVVGIGAWILDWQATGGMGATAANVTVTMALSTSQTSVSDGRLKAHAQTNGSLSDIEITLGRHRDVLLSSQTTYYMIISNTDGPSSPAIIFYNAKESMQVTARCGYL